MFFHHQCQRKIKHLSSREAVAQTYIITETMLILHCHLMNTPLRDTSFLLTLSSRTENQRCIIFIPFSKIHPLGFIHSEWCSKPIMIVFIICLTNLLPDLTIQKNPLAVFRTKSSLVLATYMFLNLFQVRQSICVPASFSSNFFHSFILFCTNKLPRFSISQKRDAFRFCTYATSSFFFIDERIA